MSLFFQKVKKVAKDLIQDESGQTTTEYVLLLLFVVLAVRAAGGTLKTQINKILTTAFGKADEAIQNAETE